MTARARSALILLCVLGAGLLAVCFYWNAIALDGAAVPDEATQNARIDRFVGSWTVAYALYAAAVCLVWRRREDAEVLLPAVIATAIVVRAVLVFAPPILETDPERYLWDGAVSAAGVNPYRWAPREVLEFGRAELVPETAQQARELVRLHGLSEDPRLRAHFLWINHPAVPTCYPPTAQGLFAVAAAIAPGNVMVLKGLVALVDLGVLALVVALLAALGRPRSLALLYAWCPLVLREYASTGHYDPLAAFFLLASLFALARGRRAFAGGLAGAAVLAKLYPVVAVAVLGRRYGARGLAVFALTVLLLVAPFASAGSRGLEGLMVFSISWMRNASVYALVQGALTRLDANPVVVPLPRALTAHAGHDAVGVALDSFVAAKVLLALVLLAGLTWIARWPDGEGEAMLFKAYAAVALAFLVSPVQNPWYVGWVLPLAVLCGRTSWLALSGTMVAYYAYHTTGTHPRAVPGLGVQVDMRWIEYLPFFVLLALEALPARRAAVAVAVAAALFAPAFARAEPAMAPPGYKVVEVPQPATLTGRVRLEGDVPRLPPLRVNSDPEACGAGKRPDDALILDAERGIANCVIEVEAREGRAPGERPPAVLDQLRCAFVPHVQTVLAGSELAIKNSDPAFHNVHAFNAVSMSDAFNVGLPASLPTMIRQTLNDPGPLVIRCDAGHVWMRAHVYVVASPYDAVTGADGRFRIAGLPPGAHRVRIWHELVGELVTPVELPAAGAVELVVTGRLGPGHGFRAEVVGAPASPKPAAP